MPEPTSGMTVPSLANASVRVNEMLATARRPSPTDLAELQRAGDELDRLLVARSVDVDGLIDAFERTRSTLQRSK